MGHTEVTTRLEALENWTAGLLSQLGPASRSKLARTIGQALRRNQQQRIISQRNPDGRTYVPRKQRKLRGKQGRVKQKMQMFQKLRTANHLKFQTVSNTVKVGFNGRIARIARVHQLGLRDRAERTAPAIKYDKREILGLTEADLDLIRDVILNDFIHS